MSDLDKQEIRAIRIARAVHELVTAMTENGYKTNYIVMPLPLWTWIGKPVTIDGLSVIVDEENSGEIKICYS